MSKSSNICIEISSAIEIANRVVSQTIYATDLYIYIESAAGNKIFLPESDRLYTIDGENRKLVLVDTSPVIRQQTQLKTMMGNVSVTKISDGVFKVANAGNSAISFEADVTVCKHEGLETTVMSAYNKFQEELQPFRIPLEPDEIIGSMNSVINFNGQKMTNKVTVTEIKENSSKAPEIDLYYQFTRA